jgi:1,2-diacylglycerol 3-beta-galactosyltransferase
MHAADVIITKAGPGTICEALSCHLPIILSGYVPGQEEGNVDYVVQNEMGVLALNASTLIDALRRYVKPGSIETKRALENGQRLSRPFASFDIAHKLLSYLPANGAASVWQSHDSRLMKRRMSGRLRSSIRIRRQHGRLPRMLVPRTARRTVLRIRRKTRDISGEARKTRD